MGVALWFPLLVLVLFVIPAVLITVLVVASLRPGPGRTPVREQREVLLARLCGLLLGIAAAWFLLKAAPPWLDLRLGRAPMVAPVIVGLGILLGVVAGELFVRRPDPNQPRTAALTPRRISDYLPRALTASVAAVWLAGIALMVYTTATASADDMGRAGRSLFVKCSATTSEGRGPYPGSFYTVPLFIAMALALAVAAYCAHRVVVKPRGQSIPGGDDALRRRSLSAVVAGLGIALTAPLVGIGFFAGTTLTAHICPPAGGTFVGAASLFIAAGAVLTTVWCVVALILGGRPTDVPAVVDNHEVSVP